VSVLCSHFVLGGTGKAEARSAAEWGPQAHDVICAGGDGTPENPERVAESDGEHMLLEQPNEERDKSEQNFTLQEKSSPSD
jgi:hypothetical protein